MSSTSVFLGDVFLDFGGRKKSDFKGSIDADIQPQILPNNSNVFQH